MWGHRVPWLRHESTGPVPLVLDLRITHDRFGSDDVVDKIRKYRVDCNNNPPKLHSEFLSLLFLQDHGETDRFFVVLGVQLP